MIIFSYRITSLNFSPEAGKEIFRIDITDDEKDNIITHFYGKEYIRTLSRKAVGQIIDITRERPELFDFPDELEPNEIDDAGTQYEFTFCDGKRTNSFRGQNILDYGSLPRKRATLALRVAREIKEKVLEPNGIRTMISSRLQHWPKYRLESDLIPPCGNITLQKIQHNSK